MSRKKPARSPRPPAPAPKRAWRPRFSMPSASDPRVWLVAIVALAVIVRLVGIGYALPEVYEEAYPFKSAWGMWGWGPARSFSLDPHFFRYPSLTIYFQLIGQAVLYVLLSVAGVVRSSLDFRALYVMDKTPFYLMGRTITVLLGAATVWPAFRLARDARGLAVGFAAALLVALEPGLIEKARVIEVDVPLALFVALGVVQSVRLARARTRGNALLMGVLAGLAASTKYPGAVLLVPGALALWLPPAPGETPAKSEKPIAPFVALAWLVAAAVGAFLLTSPYTLLDRDGFLHDMRGERQHMELGHFGASAGRSWGWYGLEWMREILGWPLGLASLAGLAWLGGVRRERFAILAGSVMLVWFAVIGSWTMKADRYLLPLVPLGLVLAAAVLADVSALVARRLPRVAPAAALGALAVLCVLPWGPRLRHAFATARDSRTEAKQWIEQNVALGSFITTEQYGPPLIGPLDVAIIDADIVKTLEARRWQPREFALQWMPMFQVVPERSARFYTLSLHEPDDWFVVTSPVRDRYRSDPKRFAAQLAFYDTLEHRFVRVKEFKAGGEADGDIVLYRNPEHVDPFGTRTEIAPPDTSLLGVKEITGGEAFYYYNLGMNYEAFHHSRQAFLAYLYAMRFPPTDERCHTNSARRIALILSRSGQAAAAEQFLEDAVKKPADPGEVDELEELRRWIRRGVVGTGQKQRKAIR